MVLYVNKYTPRMQSRELNYSFQFLILKLNNLNIHIGYVSYFKTILVMNHQFIRTAL
jgi:hypothetical protein